MTEKQLGILNTRSLLPSRVACRLEVHGSWVSPTDFFIMTPRASALHDAATPKRDSIADHCFASQKM